MKGPVRPQMTHAGTPRRASSALKAMASRCGSDAHDSGKVGKSDPPGED